MIREFAGLLPATLAACRQAYDAAKIKDGVRHLDQMEFAKVGSAPVDIEIMERTSRPYGPDGTISVPGRRWPNCARA
tara:strand:+ start:1521 stop:1751 length:231 start_codon:yes stop_codon:yes gene_type:complete